MWNKKLVAISDEEIEIMQLVLQDAEIVEIDDLSEGDRVEISRGPLLGQSGVVVQISNKTVRLRIDSMQCDMIINVSLSRIDHIKERVNKA